MGAHKAEGWLSEGSEGPFEGPFEGADSEDSLGGIDDGSDDDDF